MTAAKNEVFIKLEHENCNLVWEGAFNLWWGEGGGITILWGEVV